MSAYGAITRSTKPQEVLPTTLWKSAKGYVTTHHLTLASASALPGLLPFLHSCFAEELERGMTYPQEILQGETYTQHMFEAYYFAADVIVAVVGQDVNAVGEKINGEVVSGLDIEAARNGRSWQECIAGCYYIKPNYPGRSSHICNAGFLVPVAQRAQGYGSLLARSYLYYAPRLGYEASVFNLVYVNNVASVRLWEGLGFTIAGRIPRAGRLRTADGSGEEYVDAWVFYKRFDPVEQ
ncbi:hypothetical protein BXZ70DRAFT_1072745 [Cristinia sonorae]|uniref:N-acetyltransferase domain-containing protein n=1 Tax=Cristinia sonorae TaxID=1940300 RepID=A0A8K0XMP7_9AGAR|nr:hypothetical protein BXZ70DRAFT_1072745 [Cristinia sonorae]